MGDVGQVLVPLGSGEGERDLVLTLVFRDDCEGGRILVVIMAMIGRREGRYGHINGGEAQLEHGGCFPVVMDRDALTRFGTSAEYGAVGR